MTLGSQQPTLISFREQWFWSLQWKAQVDTVQAKAGIGMSILIL